MKDSQLNVESIFDAIDGDDRLARTERSGKRRSVIDAEQSEPYIRGIANAPSEHFLAIFMLMSCGYMLPWTSLGSLITYYKATYSANFYVKLYCAYYLPGLPISLLQYKYDLYLDLKYGSQRTYLYRGVVSFMVMMGILISLVWLKSRIALVFLFVLLGICGWLCHGTASMLASMYPPSAIAYLQTGFRCPELYTIVAVWALHLGKDASYQNLNIFYILTACMVLVGAVAWVVVVMDEKSKDFFDIKDNRLYATDLSEAMPLLRNEKGSGGVVFIETALTVPGYDDPESFVVNQNQNQNQRTNGAHNTDSSWSKNGSRVNQNQRNSSDSETVPNSYGNSEGNTFSRFSSYASPITRTRELLRSIERAAMQLQLSPGDLYTMDDALFNKIFPLCLALFVVMWCSIFQASFFAYVTSSSKNREIEQILYFVRLFADLIGRPLTRLPRPSFLKVSTNDLNVYSH